MTNCSEISNKIGAFIERGLPEEEKRVVGEHLITCAECRREHDAQRSGRGLAEALEGADAPEAVWNNIRSSIGEMEARPEAPARSRLWKPAISFAVAVLAMLLTVPVYVYFTDPGRAGTADATVETDQKKAWRIESTSGNPKIGKNGGTGTLEAGGILETGTDSTARIAVADIGRVDIAPNSLVRIVDTGRNKHRMSLERGMLKAEIVAPPRLFIVDTPSATAVDLGCAYSLEVKDDGTSRLHVTSGYVALETGGLESFVPAGAYCESRKGGRLGTPFFADSSERLRKSLADFDFEKGGRDSVEMVIAEAARKDTLTLWHLLPKVDEHLRARIVARILQEIELDDGVTVEGLLRLDREMMMELRSELEVLWYEQPGWFE